MDFISILQTVKEYIPIPVIVAVIAVIMLVYGSSLFLSVVEEYLEESWGRQIKFFNHKKIYLSLIWCIVASLTLALAKFIEWREMPFYLFVIMGASTFCYEAFLKKFGVKKASHRLTSFVGKANSSFIVNGLYEQGTIEQFSLWAKFLSC